MSKRKQKEKKQQKIIAKKRIQKLFSMAEFSALTGKITLANHYVEIARKISMKYLVPIPKDFKRNFCKHCHYYLVPNQNCRIRIHRSKIVIYCYNCKNFTRLPIKNKKTVSSNTLK